MPIYTGRTDDYLAKELNNSPFYPVIKVGDFERDYRVPTEFIEATVIDNLLLSMVEINIALADQQTAWQADGISTLDAVPGDAIGEQGNEKNPHTINYYRAVFCKAKQLLLQQFSSMSPREQADNSSKNSEQTQGWWMKESSAALRALKGEGHRRISVETL